EAIYIRWAQIMRNEPALRFIPLSDGKQPLFMWVVIISQKFIKDPLIAGRLVSLFAGLVTMVGIFSSTLVLFSSKSKAGKKDGISFPAYLRSIFSPDNKKVLGVAIIASFVYAISPYTVFFDRMALVDSMLCMFGVWTFVFSLIAFKFLRLDCAMLAGFSLGGAYLTKSPALFFLISLPSNWILAKWPKKDRKKIIKFIKLSALTIVIAAMGLAMFNLLRLGPNFHLLSRRNLDYVHPISRFLEYPFDPMFVFLKKIFGYFWFLGPGSIIVAYIVSLISGIKRNFKQYLVLSAWSILPMIAVSEFSKTMTARYVLFTLPYIIIISASGFLSDSKFIKKIMPVLIVVFSIQSLWINRLLLVDVSAAPLPQGERAGYLEEWTSGTGIKDVSEYFKAYQDNNPEEKIVVGTEGYFGTLPDGLQAYLYDYPQITVIGIGTRIRQLPKDLYESKVYGNKTFLVINNSRLITDHNKLKLKLISSYPKALRAEWTNEYKSLGPQEVLYMFEVTNDTVRIYEDMIKNEKN
ncbi:glycosyltransferase family 39 protein, partial [Candidatus Woesebacteria bacterium]|nr:glycosyltransferase family 39 protein [Candidatus Woesebacteria bacterium]